ncbi:MAG TPA: hypothetical protein VMI34_25160 [Candidatus Bathyarchaeia archaeon]|nr:hypothetical protein [Candidatus Bathyarchaeia archaeon]
MTARRAAAALVLVALGALAARSDAQSILDFITFDGIDYIRWTEEPGRALGADDLGVEFAVVGCSFTEDRHGCPYGTDAAAAFMPTGSRIHTVKGHSTDFRLAAVWQGKIFLYQAWRNPRAKVGGDLYAIAGKVRAIDVQRGEPTWAAPGIPVRISSPRDADVLVDLVVRGTVRRPQAHAFGEPRYWLTFWLSDGTTLGRTYFVETRELMGGVLLPEAFTRILERYLPG